MILHTCLLLQSILYAILFIVQFFVPSSLGLLCYSSGCLVVMDSLTSGKQWQLVGHPTEVSTIALQQDGCGLASASPAHSDWSCEVRVWSLEAKKCIKVGILVHSSGANSHVVQISMLHPLHIMFIPIGWQKLFQAAITAANNAVATI